MTEAPKLLLIDDNAAVLSALELLFMLDGYQTISASSPAAALKHFAQTPFDLVVQDMNFSNDAKLADSTSGADGMVLFADLRAINPDVPIVLLTAWTHLEQAVELVKAGAADYLAKPWNDDKLRVSVRNLLELGEQRRLAQHAALAAHERAQVLAKIDLRGGLFVSSAMQTLVSLAARVAVSDLPVLITGANGAGKERIAEIVHYNSNVKTGPLIVLNCGALPSELIEAELFGADAGAYTGAVKAREGRFDAANGGTLFLDEIGNLSLSGQMKLLRVLESGEFERLGSSKTRRVKVRVISATNSDLPAMIRAGQFREDLYYRLNVVPLVVPPLAMRVSDILPLARLYLGTARLSQSAEIALKVHSWPGNVRELRNAITRAQLMCDAGIIQAHDLGLKQFEPAEKPAVAEILAPTLNSEPNQTDIEAALLSAGQNISEAAANLGLSRQSLYRRMQRFGIARSES